MTSHHHPVFSIVTPVYKPTAEHLQMTIDSVRNQSFSDWEWNLVDDASKDPEITSVLRAAEKEDPRIHVLERKRNGHIVAASNDGLAMSRGTWIVLLDHDDLLVDTALERIESAIQNNPNAGYVYSDEDKVDDAGNFSDEFRKPDWSPERLRHQMYLGHLSALRADLVQSVGGFHQGFDGSQDHDLALRVTEISPSVVHIPEILYHWRIVPGSAAGDANAKDYATEAGIKAVQEHLHRIGCNSDIVSVTEVAHTYRTIRAINSQTRVSVVIPTRGGTSLVWGERRCLVVETARSLVQHTELKNLEIIVVFDTNTPGSVLEQLREFCGHRLVEVPYSATFNFSDKCNQGFLAASGDTIVFLNDDVEIESENFVEQLCAPLEEDTVGMTGARLVHADGTIQHAGLVFQNSDFIHAYIGQPDHYPGYFGELFIDHEVSGLTAACVALRREVFEEVGGFSLELPVNFNDVDFSYKVRSTGRRLVWLADVRATHFESLTRSRDVHEWELNRVLSRWGRPDRDHYMPMESQRLRDLLDASRIGAAS